MFKYSDVDSNRFNLNIFRGQIEDIDEKKVNEEIIQNNIDVLIFRIPSQKQYLLPKLSNLGFPIIVADTLVYYTVDLDKYLPKEPKNNLEFIECTYKDKQIVNELVMTIFKDYTNHYFSNPILDKEEILEGYQEWVINFINDNQEKKKVWLVKKEEKFVGFATTTINQEKLEAEGVLYGVHPNYSGGGIYSDLIRFTQDYHKRKGIKKMKVSTQIQNFAVQKVWSREGFMLSSAYCTVHINAMMNKLMISKKSI